MKIITNSLFKILITVILSLLILIGIKASSTFKNKFYRKVYEENISFAKINSLYNTYFGNIFPKDKLDVVQPVFKETLNYSHKETYLDGVNLTITEDYLVPSISSGVVVYIGKKENYGNVVIISNTEGIDIWYGNMDSIDLKLYDYIESGSYLGKASNNLYMVFKKDGNVLNYEDYL